MVEEGVEHEELGLRGFDFNLFHEDRGVCVGENVKELTYLLMLTKLCLGDLEDQIYQINKKADEENGRGGTQENGIFGKLWRFSRNEFWKNIGCFMSEPTFSLGGYRLLEKDPKISRNKRKSY